ncbi:hypothetical protein LXL04_034570 [Taraxacum kok-saghyz]
MAAWKVTIMKSGCYTDAQRREETGGADSFLPVETKQVVARGWSHIRTEQGDDRVYNEIFGSRHVFWPPPPYSSIPTVPTPVIADFLRHRPSSMVHGFRYMTSVQHRERIRRHKLQPSTSVNDVKGFLPAAIARSPSSAISYCTNLLQPSPSRIAVAASFFHLPARCGSNKYNLESCISVYNHAFAFPLSVEVPATKRGKWGE